MTGTCTICGLALEAPADAVFDAQRDERTMARLIALMKAHLEKEHDGVALEGLETYGLVCSILQGGNALLVLAQNCYTSSYIDCKDAFFQLKVEGIRAAVTKLIEQKKPKPVVTLQ